MLAGASVERTSERQAISAATIAAITDQPEPKFMRGLSAFFSFQDAGLVV
jgi:hypothetical protein